MADLPENEITTLTENEGIGRKIVIVMAMKRYIFSDIIPYSFLPLGATALGELWPPEQSASISPCSSFVQTMKRRMVE
jgi:hypothetical protein